MSNWTATTTANATPEQLLDVLTRPEKIQDWAPVDFDLEDWRRLSTGTRTRVTGRLAGMPVEFDVEVHRADEAGLRLSADGPIGLDVRYELAPVSTGAELNASVSLRAGGGLTGRLVTKATQALLSAGALEGAAGRIAAAAEVRLAA
ncbi:MAG: SRPBCC family protein [Thermoleophilaceae bacterium]